MLDDPARSVFAIGHQQDNIDHHLITDDHHQSRSPTPIPMSWSTTMQRCTSGSTIHVRWRCSKMPRQISIRCKRLHSPFMFMPCSTIHPPCMYSPTMYEDIDDRTASYWQLSTVNNNIIVNQRRLPIRIPGHHTGRSPPTDHWQQVNHIDKR